MIEVKDNFLTDEEFKTVTEILHPKFVPWSFQQVVGCLLYTSPSPRD